jgi:uncharacterized membrane protein YbaN (DUF454 family)
MADDNRHSDRLLLSSNVKFQVLEQITKMSKQAVLEIASKIFGLYCFVQFIQSTPAIIAAIVVDNAEFIPNKTLHIFLTSLYPLIFFVLAYIFLMKSEIIIKIIGSGRGNIATIESNFSENDSLPYKLHFWIIILGIFYFISAISRVLIGIGTLSYKLRDGWFIAHDPLLPQTITLILSIFCIFRSEQVAKFIETKSKKLNKRLQSDADEPRR